MEKARLWRLGSLLYYSLSHTLRKAFVGFGEGNGNPLQCSCLENPRDGRAWWAAIYGVAQSRTRLKRLSSSSRDLHTSLKTAGFYVQFKLVRFLFFFFKQQIRIFFFFSWMKWQEWSAKKGTLDHFSSANICWASIPVLVENTSTASTTCSYDSVAVSSSKFLLSTLCIYPFWCPTDTLKK